MPFGSLLIFDLNGCEGQLDNREILQEFINELVIDIMKMKIIGETQFAYFKPNLFNVQNDLVGYSITTIISLSSITIHICELSKTAYLDIFTCCAIDKNMLIEINNLIQSVFKPSSLNTRTILRPIKNA